MGRKKKYTNEEDRIAALRESQMRYYWKNKEELNKKNTERYYKKTHPSLSTGDQLVEDVIKPDIMDVIIEGME